MINIVLVRWARGWHEVLDTASIAAHGRFEAMLALGAVESVTEVDRVGAGQLARWSDVREEIAADLKPVDATDTPYTAFSVADTITVPDSDGTPTAERVVALTVAEDENGQLSWVPELKDVLLTSAQRWEQAIARMADGAVGGLSAVASPLPLTIPPMPIGGGGGTPAAPGLPPVAVLKGETSVLSGAMPSPPIALAWWQSAGIDSYITVADRNGGHGFTVLADCDLQLTMELDTTLQATGAGDIAIGIDVYRLTGDGTVDQSWGGWNAMDGSWSRAAFPAGAQNVAGFSTTRTFNFSGGSTWALDPQVYNGLPYTREFDWKLTAKLLESTTPRTLPEIPEQ